ncbi:MAG: ATP-binding cassette domain-containing protein [Gemmatimonadetes bacterium]|nr:ATP-binding cassette domain-containing protein [Gemmatimonadota bacterium]
MPDTVSQGRQWRVHISDLTLRRARQVVLERFSWEHAQGEIAWVIGENGAGKSSLLRALAGCLLPTAGEVRYSGPGPVTRLYYHPGMRLPAGVTVGDWSRLVARLVPGGVSSHPLAAASATAEKEVTRLSTGEAKRLLLDALFRREAAVTLLDEPYEHLSAAARHTLTELLLERARTGVVIVTTNQEIPEKAARVVLRVDAVRVLAEPA